MANFATVVLLGLASLTDGLGSGAGVAVGTGGAGVGVAAGVFSAWPSADRGTVFSWMEKATDLAVSTLPALSVERNSTVVLALGSTPRRVVPFVRRRPS